MFNNYVWQLYLSSTNNEVVELFEASLVDPLPEVFVQEICDLHLCYCPSKDINKNRIRWNLEELYKDMHDEKRGFLYGCYSIFEMPEDTFSIDEIYAIFIDGLAESGAKSDKETMEEFIHAMVYYTTFLSICFPEFFVPYCFQYNYNILEKIAHEFDILLPPVPVKKDYLGRIKYYLDICKALYEFREANGLSPYELCAFLYDFAPKYIGGTESYIISDLPDPKGIFFIGGDKDDEFLSDNVDIITPWQCNPDVKAGDLVVMYLRTPISSIDSIWRSVSVGFNDPFFFYYRCTYIAKPEKVKRIPLKKLQTDKVFKRLPIVRKNMQGINGVELMPSVYNHILDVSKSELSRLDFGFEERGDDFQREKDVEDKLIKPLLKQLGYTEDEYLQQLYIRVGNHNFALIPDFVIHPVVSFGHQSADFLIEAKLTIPSNKELEVVKGQARGYAKLLSAKFSVLISKEGIWITEDNDDYSTDVLKYTWEEMKSSDVFSQVFKLLGNSK